jgi:hypothetical protein
VQNFQATLDVSPISIPRLPAGSPFSASGRHFKRRRIVLSSVCLGDGNAHVCLIVTEKATGSLLEQAAASPRPGESPLPS